MKINMLYKSLAICAALPLVALAENPDVTSTSKAGTSASAEKMEAKPEKSKKKDAIVRKTDGVYIYKAGEPTKVESTMVATEGVTVEPNGKIVWASGKEMMLTEGQKVAFDGTMLKEPKAASPDRDAIQGGAGAKD